MLARLVPPTLKLHRHQSSPHLPFGPAAMGKRTTGKHQAAGEENEARKTRPARWAKTACTVTALRSLEHEGLLRPKDEKTWRLPGNESSPSPTSHERVAFVDHVHRGLSFPLHPFFIALMCDYEIQLHDLPPNSIQHVSCFVVLCECYLGVRPHWALFKRIFRVKSQPNKDNPNQLGGCNIQPKIPYFTMGFLDSAIGWKSKWFYAKDTPSGSDVPLADMSRQAVQRAS